MSHGAKVDSRGYSETGGQKNFHLVQTHANKFLNCPISYGRSSRVFESHDRARNIGYENLTPERWRALLQHAVVEADWRTDHCMTRHWHSITTL